MAAFQTMTGANLPAAMTLFVGNVLKTKIVPGAGELVPFTVAISPEGVLAKVKDDARVQPNFQVLEFRADAAGAASVSAENAKGVKVGPLAITVKDKLELPSAITDRGALVRLLLAEAPSPFAAGYSSLRAKSGMEWMELVVQNRLDMKSALVGSAGAQTYIDVIKAQGQFEGFAGYPTIGSKQQKNIDEIVAIANDGTHPKQKQFFDHVTAAIEVSSKGTITDPCATKLLSWRTAGASGPGGTFTLYQSFAGQDFYTIPAAKPKAKK
jgi:hypothetical protein